MTIAEGEDSWHGIKERARAERGEKSKRLPAAVDRTGSGHEFVNDFKSSPRSYSLLKASQILTSFRFIHWKQSEI